MAGRQLAPHVRDWLPTPLDLPQLPITPQHRQLDQGKIVEQSLWGFEKQ
jgi:hypothetical protein